jgi:Tfp pilus assembly protein FimV
MGGASLDGEPWARIVGNRARKVCSLANIAGVACGTAQITRATRPIVAFTNQTGIDMGINSDYIATMKAQLKQWDADLDALGARTQAASAEARAASEERIRELRASRDAAQKALMAMRASGEAAGAQMKAGLEAAWKSLQKGLQRASSSLGG